MNYQTVGGEVVGKVVPLAVFEFQLAPHVLPQPARQFDPADILADGVVGAGFADQCCFPDYMTRIFLIILIRIADYFETPRELSISGA